MKSRYLLFKGECYYPMGGWGDLDGGYDSKEEAVTNALKWAAAELKKNEYVNLWWHVVDTDALDTAAEEEVASGDEHGESKGSD